MNKADEKRLKADPRYGRIMAAHAVLMKRSARLSALKQKAIDEFATACDGVEVDHEGLGDEAIFRALRPHGDKCRLGFGTWDEREIESVTAHRVFVGGDEYDRKTGRRRGGYSRIRIHLDDLDRINAGELVGWRQKPWGSQ